MVGRRFQTFLSFCKHDERRRSLSDCLDVRLMANWVRRMRESGASMKVIFMGVFCFRHFNRVQTWALLYDHFELGATTVDWAELNNQIRDAPKLNKAYAIPAVYKGASGYMKGEDFRENTILLLQKVWKSKEAGSIATVLDRGVTTTGEWHQFRQQMLRLASVVPGAFGTYRQKNHADIWVAAKVIHGSALNSYYVSQGAGSDKSLKHLYGIPASRSLEEHTLEALLVHLWHKFVQMRPPYYPGRDTLATLQLALCGWERSRQQVLYKGKIMTGLTRAIAIEEEEYLEVVNDLQSREAFDE